MEELVICISDGKIRISGASVYIVKLLITVVPRPTLSLCPKKT